MPEIATATSPSPAISKIDFLKRMTFQERVAIETACETDPEVRVVKQGFLAAESIKFDDSETIAGMSLYVSKGLITQARCDEILS